MKNVKFQGNGFSNTHSAGSCVVYTLNPARLLHSSDFLEMWLVVGGVKGEESQHSDAGVSVRSFSQPTARVYKAGPHWQCYGFSCYI